MADKSTNNDNNFRIILRIMKNQFPIKLLVYYEIGMTTILRSVSAMKCETSWNSPSTLLAT